MSRDNEINDEEETPLDGTVVPAHLQTPAEAYERDGQWFIKDPTTGEEIPIVPAKRETEEAPPPKPSLLSTTKGKLIIGALAALVITLFSLALLKPAPQDDDTIQLSSQQFEETINKVLDHLERDNLDQAQKLALFIEQARPNSDPAHILVELTRLWPRWENDFFEYWLPIKQQLSKLEQSHDSRTVNKFVQEYKSTIDQELLNSQSISRARRIYESGNLEMAWRAIMDIPPDSYARNLEADFIETLHDKFHSYLQTRMKRAQDRKDWDAAYENAQKIIRYFPQEKSRIKELAATFAKNKEHVARLDETEDLMDKQDYQEAIRILEEIPEDSIYAQDARDLRQQSERGIRISKATDAYNQGDVKDALKLLRGYEDDESVELEKEIRTVTEIYRRATEATEKGDLLKAEELWEEIQRITSMRPENHYFAEAARHLDLLPEMRKRHAEELVEKAQNEFRNSNYIQARSYYEEAVKLDPAGDIGMEGIKRLRNEGRIAYSRACNTEDPQQAIELFEEAIQLLSPEDKYYGWAQQRKEEVEKRLKENS